MFYSTHTLGGRMPLLSARPTITTERHCPSVSTRVYCLLTQAYVCKQLALSCYMTS